MTYPTPPHRRYLPDGAPGPPWRGPPPEPVQPRPGHGTVFIVENRDGTWWGSWQDSIPAAPGERAVPGIEEMEGPLDVVLRWARSRPAGRHLIFSAAANDYVPLPDE